MGNKQHFQQTYFTHEWQVHEVTPVSILMTRKGNTWIEWSTVAGALCVYVYTETADWEGTWEELITCRQWSIAETGIGPWQIDKIRAAFNVPWLRTALEEIWEDYCGPSANNPFYMD